MMRDEDELEVRHDRISYAFVIAHTSWHACVKDPPIRWVARALHGCSL